MPAPSMARRQRRALRGVDQHTVFVADSAVLRGDLAHVEALANRSVRQLAPLAPWQRRKAQRTAVGFRRMLATLDTPDLDVDLINDALTELLDDELVKVHHAATAESLPPPARPAASPLAPNAPPHLPGRTDDRTSVVALLDRERRSSRAAA
jgi:hypothetical protein